MQALRTAALTSWRRRTAEARMLVVMLLLSSVACLVSAVLPMTPEAPVEVIGALSVVGAVAATAVWSSTWRGWLHVGPLIVLSGLTAIITASVTPAGEATTAICFVWIALYAALFFPRPVARAYVGLVAAALAAALALNPYDGAVHTWALVVVTTAVAAEALAANVGWLHKQAVTDPLTGLLNREGLRRAGERVLAGADRSGAELTVVVLDLDGFKGVNDRHGHAAGDRLLVDLAAAWTRELRPTDLLARYGGDEFVLVLPQTDGRAAKDVLGRLRDVSVTTWSYGLARHRPGAALAELLHAADADLYDAKAARPVGPTATSHDGTPTPEQLAPA